AEFVELAAIDDEAPECVAMGAVAIATIIFDGGAHVEACGRVEAGVVDKACKHRVDGSCSGGHWEWFPGLKRFFKPCQHSKYSCCRMRVFIANSVGRTASWVSNMKARVLARY